MRKTVETNGSVEASTCARRGQKLRSTRRRSTAFLTLALGLATLGAFATFADEPREWVNSDGETICRGTLDVERTLDDAPGDGAPNKVYFRTADGEEITYRYRWLNEDDRKRVLAALDAPPKQPKPKQPEKGAEPPTQTSASTESAAVGKLAPRTRRAGRCCKRCVLSVCF